MCIEENVGKISCLFPKNKNNKNDWFILTFGISFPRSLSDFIPRNWVFDMKFKNWKIIILTFRLLLIRLSL